MTPKQIKDAYAAIQELTGVVFPYKVSRAVAALRKRLREELDVVASMEESLVEHYGGIVQKNGSAKIPPESRQAFAEHYNSMMLEDNPDIKLPVADVSAHIAQIRISPGAVDALEGLVIFEEVKLDA